MKRQQGVALLTALLITALATITVAAMLERLDQDIHRGANLLHRQQAQWYALGAEAWAKQILARDNANRDHLQEPWATRMPPTPVEGGLITGWLEDLQGRFNLNNLVEKGQAAPEALKRFRRLLQALDLPLGLAEAAADWIDADLDPLAPNGVEDYAYLAAIPPRRAANQPLRAPTELRWLPELTRDHWRVLAPHVCALPAPTPLNLNTASPEVLRTLDENWSDTFAEDLRQQVAKSGFEKRETAQKVLDGAKLTPEPDLWSLNSQYFALHAEVEIGRVRLRSTSILHRGGQGVEVIYRDFDG